MPIVIKELFGSDPLSEALEKINFNFDQIILAGGGPPGPEGPQGVAGVPGPQGDRGDHWQVGAIAPTADHGPGFGSLLQNDLWTSSTGQIYAWNAVLSLWIDTNVNLTGPQGATGADGGSYEWDLYKGNISTYRTPDYIGAGTSTNWLPSTILPVDDNDVNFIVPVGAGKNSLLLGDINWTKFNLNNFVGWDGAVPGSYPNQTPKLTLIQNSIDFVGFGGLAIGAYGMTSATGPGITPQDLQKFQGGLANNLAGTTGPVGDARNMFFAGLAIKQESINGSQVLSHVFRARTNTIDFEIQAGDNNPVVNAGKSPSVSISNINSTVFKGIVSTNENGGNDLVRSVIGPTYSRYRDSLFVGFDTSSLSSTLPNYISISNSSKFITNGNARIGGDLYVGSPSIASQNIELGYRRTVSGNSLLNFYTDHTNNTTSGFNLVRSSGENGNATITQIGTGNLNINTSISGIGSVQSGDIIFNTRKSNEFLSQKVIIKANGNVGIGNSLTPLVKLHVKSNSEILRLEGDVGGHAFMSFYPQGPSTRFGYIGYPSNGSTDLNIFNEDIGGTGRINLATGNITRVTIGPTGNVGIGLGGSNPVGGANNTLQINTSSVAVGASANIGLTTSSTGNGFYLRNYRNSITTADNTFQLLYANTYNNLSLSSPFLTVKTNGAIGIGTTAPDTSLHVNGIIKSDLSLGGMMVLSNPDLQTTGGQFLGSQIYSGRASFTVLGNPSSSLFTGARTISTSGIPTATQFTPYNPTNYDIQTINSSGILTSRIFVSGYTGSVGINTSNPQEKLHIVDGNIKMSRGNIIYNPRLSGPNGTFDLKPEGFGFGLRLVQDVVNGGINNRNFQIGSWDNNDNFTRLLIIGENGAATFSGNVYAPQSAAELGIFTEANITQNLDVASGNFYVDGSGSRIGPNGSRIKTQIAGGCFFTFNSNGAGFSIPAQYGNPGFSVSNVTQPGDSFATSNGYIRLRITYTGSPFSGNGQDIATFGWGGNTNPNPLYYARGIRFNLINLNTFDILISMAPFTAGGENYHINWNVISTI